MEQQLINDIVAREIRVTDVNCRQLVDLRVVWVPCCECFGLLRVLVLSD